MPKKKQKQKTGSLIEVSDDLPRPNEKTVLMKEVNLDCEAVEIWFVF